MAALPAALPTLALMTVAIDLPPETSEPARERVVENCEAALGDDRCLLGEDARADWYAKVRWHGAELSVTLAHDRARGVVVAHRQVAFSENDSEEQRWVAAGLIVAALTVAQFRTQEEERAPAEAPPVRDERVTAPPEPSTEEPFGGALDLGGLVGRGLLSSEPRVGGLVRGWFVLRRLRVGFTTSLNMASSFTDPGVLWYGASAGIGTVVTDESSRFGVDLRGEIVLEQAHVRATRQGAEETASSSWRGGGQLGAVFSYRIARWIVPWLAADVALIRPELRLRVADETIGAEGPVRWTFSLGGRFHWGSDRE